MSEKGRKVTPINATDMASEPEVLAQAAEAVVHIQSEMKQALLIILSAMTPESEAAAMVQLQHMGIQANPPGTADRSLAGFVGLLDGSLMIQTFMAGKLRELADASVNVHMFFSTDTPDS